MFSNTWTEVNGGGRALSGPAPVFFDGELNVFVRGTDQRIYGNVRRGAGFVGWTEVPGDGRTPAGIAAEVDYDGALCLYVRGTDDRIYENLRPAGGSFRGWSEVPGAGRTPSGPAASYFHSAQGDRTLYLYVRGTDNLVYVNTRGINRRGQRYGWTGWHSIGSQTTSTAPAAAARIEQQVVTHDYLFVTGPTGAALYENLADDSLDWHEVPGSQQASSGPGTTVIPTGAGTETLYLFARAPNDVLVSNVLRGLYAWGGWRAVPGGMTTTLEPGATSDGSSLFLFVTDGAQRIMFNTDPTP